MHTKHYFSILTMAGLLSAAGLTGCVDQDYSLDDIDMEMQFQFNDLALPVNVSPVKLSSIIDLSEQDDVEIVDGKYVLLRSDDFSSNEIHIKAFNANATPTDNSSPEVTIPLPLVTSGFSAPISYIHHFNYNYDEVDKHIIDITTGVVDMDLSIALNTKFKNGKVLTTTFSDLKIVLPKGFYGTLSTGQTIKKGDSNIVTIKSAQVDKSGTFSFVFHVTEFDRELAGGSLDVNHGRFILETSMGIESGTISYNGSETGPAEISVQIAISPLEIITIDGTVGYDMEEWSTIVNFDNLPDVLTDPQTNLSFYNPQVYLSLTNPLGTSAYATTGIEISQIRNSGAIADPAILDSPFTINNIVRPQEFCLLPHPADMIKYHEFENAEPIQMSNLGDIVAGDGFPQGLTVRFVNPGFPVQKVKDFPLDFSGKIGGSYTLFAPLQLAPGSKVVYQDSATGWGLSTDSEEMNIKYLSLEADVTSHLPVAIIFTANPIDSNGNLIKNIKVDQIEIPAGRTSHINIKMEGDINDLDGMEYTASLISADDSKALTPDSYIELNGVKVRVTGNYIVKEDKDED